MSKIVDKIKQIIKTDDLEYALSYNAHGLNLDIVVEEIDRNEKLDEVFRRYIVNNCKSDDIVKKLEKYEVEKIKYWYDDLVELIYCNPRYTDGTNERILCLKEKFFDLFRKENIKAYMLVDPSVNTGRKFDVEYDYECGYILSNIRCYETEKERFILLFNWSD